MPPAEAASSSASPAAAWVYLTDPESGQSYYANTTTRATSWSMPDELKAVIGHCAEPLYVKLANGWLQFEDDDTGRFYFHHRKSGRTVWVMPQEARPPTTAASDAAVFEAGMRDEPEDEGEEDEEDDDVDEPDELDEEAMLEASPSMAPGASPPLDRASSTDDAAAKAQKRAARRLKILEEILLSERKYVQSLLSLMKVYLVPLRTVAEMPAGKGQIFTHADLDAVFLNIDMITKVNEHFLQELEAELQLRQGRWEDVQYGEIIKRGARQFKGCYTRYVTHYDAAEAHLQKLKESDKDKHRYLEVCKTHPDAGGLDVRSFLIQPVQRVPRYRMLLEDLLKHTDADHADEAPLRESLSRVCEVAMHINEEKRHLDGIEQMRQLIGRFANGAVLEKELVSYERRLLREGALAKVRMSKTQQRLVYLCNDVLLYATRGKGGVGRELVLKGKIWLHDGARVVLHPSTESAPHAFAIVAKGGRGYTWLAESEAEQREWFDAIRDAIDDCRAGGARRGLGASRMASQILSLVERKTPEARVQAISIGSCLTKYNVRDGKTSLRWVKLHGNKVVWGDARSRKCDESKGQSLDDATALIHGASSSSFFRKGTKSDDDWRCFSIVFKERTLDFAATNAEQLLDWYLALAALIPHSSEPLLDEEQLRQRIESMVR